MMFRFLQVASILLVTVASVGCKSAAPAPKAHDHGSHAGHQPAPAVQADANEPAGPRLETDSFVLEVASTEPSLSVGKPGAVAIALEGRGEWHVNQEYPIRIDIKAGPGAGLVDEALGKDDAKEFTEDNAKFLASLEPVEAGEHDVRCDVSFAMCTDENCVLERRTIAMQVKVE
ncbi:MAG: hypothetical protein AAF500_11980 [Myxococcota bacterium]